MIRNIDLKTLVIVSSLIVGGCAEKQTVQFEVTNPLDMARSFETVELDLDLISAEEQLQLTSGKTFSVIEVESNNEVVSQLSDTDGDGKADVLLFQPEIAAISSKVYTIALKDIPEESDEIPTCYSRFVPERTDDYAWENDRVAFRTYGPTAQKMIEDSIPGGTLSSGIDAWLKRVDYPIINKWYKKELETEGTYHEDNGEGLDNFHVGTSRGVGGIAIKTDTTYAFSKNFQAYKTLEAGPIRTSFWISYAPWNAGEDTIVEKKYISLDRGSNLSKFKIEIAGSDTLWAGLTLHEKDGHVNANVVQGWASYWEPHEDSELGTAIVAIKGTMMDYETYDVEAPDLSNLYVKLASLDGNVEYYAGFGWKKSGQFSSEKEWINYLQDFAEKINNPMQIIKLE